MISSETERVFRVDRASSGKFIISDDRPNQLIYGEGDTAEAAWADFDSYSKREVERLKADLETWTEKYGVLFCQFASARDLITGLMAEKCNCKPARKGTSTFRRFHASHLVCPRRVKLWGFIPMPWRCGRMCEVDSRINEVTCPHCGLKRPLNLEEVRVSE